MIHLRNPYICINDNGKKSFGGNQGWFTEKRLSRWGCGLVGIGDVILYLTGTGRIRKTAANSGPGSEKICSKAEYLRYLKELERKYFYVSYLIRGKTGIGLAIGFNLFSCRQKSPYRAVWGVPSGKVHAAILNCLERDIPVLFSVGANFPRIWGKTGINLYVKQGGNYCKSTVTHKHYMTVTGIVREKELGEMLQVSSWGREYYMRWQEYEEYMRHNSLSLLTNILFITEKKQKF